MAQSVFAMFDPVDWLLSSLLAAIPATIVNSKSSGASYVPHERMQLGGYPIFRHNGIPCKLISHVSPQKHRERERSIFATTKNYCRDIWYEYSKIAYSYPTLPLQINARLSNIHIHHNNCVWVVFMVCFYTRHTCIDIKIYLYTYLYFLIHTYRYDIHFQNHICFDIMNIYIYIFSGS